MLWLVLMQAPWPALAQEVEPRSGRLLFAVTDLVVRAGPTNLAIGRWLGADAPGLLGGKWTLSLESRLTRSAEAVQIQDGSTVKLFVPEEGGSSYRSADGERIAFEPDGTANWLRTDLTRDAFDPQGRRIARDLRNGNVLRYAYDAAGRLVAVEGPRGLSLRSTLDAEGRLTRIDATDGEFVRYAYAGDNLVEIETSRSAPIRYAYDAGGRLVRIDDAATGAVEIAYDPEGRVIRRQWADGTAERYEYEAAIRRTRKIEASGAVTTWQFSEDGLRQQITDAGGRHSSTEFDAAGHLLRATGPTGLVTELGYDAQGRLTRSKDPAGEARFEYLGETSLLRSVTPPNGQTQMLVYDPNGNLLEVQVEGETAARMTYTPDGLLAGASEPGGSARSFAYDAQGRAVSVTDSLGHATRYEFDERGNVVGETGPAGGVTTRRYDGKGRLVAETDPNGYATDLEYDPAGRMARSIGSDGVETRYEHDSVGRLIAVTGPDGRRIATEFDSARGLSTTQYPDGLREVVRFDPAGQPVEIVDVLGRATGFEYDPLGRLAARRLPSGQRVAYGYDSAGRLSRIEDGLGGVLRYQWDPSGSLSATIDQSGAAVRFGYDRQQRLTTITDALGFEKRLAYGPGDHLASVSTPTGETASFQHDSEGRLTGIRQPDGTQTRLGWDASDNLAEVSDDSGLQIRHGYNAADDRISTTDASGRAISYRFDPNGRLAEKTLPDGTSLRFRYNQAGALAEAADGRFPLRFDYDEQQRLLRGSYPAIGASVTYAYDASGLTTSLGIESRQGTVYRAGYAYDDQKRLSALVLPNGGEIRLSYDQADRLTAIQYPNGVKGTWRYTATSRVAAIRYDGPAGRAVAGWEYTYDAAGNPTQVQASDSASRTYRYDPDGRLIQESSHGRTIGYAYAPGGNRIARTTGGEKLDYRYERGRLVAAGADRLAYDANGNLLTRGGAGGAATYAYDAEGRLVRANANGGAPIAFGYGPTGQRAWRQDRSGQTFFLYDGLDLVAEADGAGRISAFYLHGPGIDWPLAMLRDGKAYFFHADALGSVAAVTDEGGALAATYETDAFGRLLAPAPKLPNPFIFTGREYDPALGIYYYRARYYDPDLGRFLSPDPLLGSPADPRTLNRYVYALNAPTRYRDPLGLDPQTTTYPRYIIDYAYWERFHGLDPAVLRYMAKEIARRIQTDPDYVRAYGGNPPTGRELLSAAHFLLESALGSKTGNPSVPYADRPGARPPGVLLDALREHFAGPQSKPETYIAGKPDTSTIEPLEGGGWGEVAPAVDPGRKVPTQPVIENPLRGGHTAATRIPGGNTESIPGAAVSHGSDTQAMPKVPEPGGLTPGAIIKGAITNVIVGSVVGGALNAAECRAGNGSWAGCGAAFGWGALGGAIGAPIGAVLVKGAELGVTWVVGRAVGAVLGKAAGAAVGAAAGAATVVGLTAGGLGYAGGRIIAKAAGPTRQEAALSNAVLNQVDLRMVDVEELRSKIAGEIAAFEKLVAEASALQGALAGLATSALGPSQLLPVKNRRAACEGAAPLVAAIDQATTQAQALATDAANKIATEAEPPDSTPLLLQAAQQLGQIRTGVGQMRKPAQDVKPFLQAIQEGTAALEAIAAAETEYRGKVGRYETLTAGFPAEANRLEGRPKEFAEKTKQIYNALRQLRVQVAARDIAAFDRRLDTILNATLPEASLRDAIAKARNLAATSQADVAKFAAALKEVFAPAHEIGADEAGACDKFTGAAEAGGFPATVAGVEQLGRLLTDLQRAFDGRLAWLKTFSETDERLLNEVGPKALKKAQDEHNQADLKKVEAILQQVQSRKKPTSQEMEHAKKGLADAKASQDAVQEVASALAVAKAQ